VSRLAFVDTETVTLEPGHDVIWEIGIITRDPDRPDEEWLYQVRPNMGKARPESLEVSRFEERYELGDRQQAAAWFPAAGGRPQRLTADGLAMNLRLLLAGRHVWGSTPGFDLERLSAMLRRQWGKTPGYHDPWHYKPHDVKDYAAGYLRCFSGREVPDGLLDLPYDSVALSQAMGVFVQEADRHTALGDARWARDLYDAVTDGMVLV
jgi:hypothetical protein